MEQLIPQQSGRVTEQEYLRMEELSPTRHEFRQGRIVDMAGGTAEHAGIASNLITEMGIRFKGKPCKAYGSDLRVRINESGGYCYPDVMVVCGPLEYANADQRTIVVNPKAVIEVTSPSTEADDRGIKFSDYRSIDSLQEYMLVSQDQYQVETFYRQSDGIWAIGPTFSGLTQSVHFRSLGIDIPLAEIYAGVQLLPKPAKTAAE